MQSSSSTESDWPDNDVESSSEISGNTEISSELSEDNDLSSDLSEKSELSSDLSSAISSDTSYSSDSSASSESSRSSDSLTLTSETSDETELSSEFSDDTELSSELSEDTDLSSELSEETEFSSDLSTVSFLSSDSPFSSDSSSSSSCHESVLLHEITFSGGFRIKRDHDGVLYPTPEWKDNSNPLDGDNVDAGDFRSPYLYKRKTKLVIGDATWKLLPGSHISGRRKIYVRGFGTGGINIPETEAGVDVQGGWIWIAGVTATKAFPDSTKYYPAFTINWEMRCSGEPWMPVGPSSHIIYVSLVDPPTHILFRTVAHLACSNEGATTDNQATAKSWELLVGLNWKGWDEASESWTRVLDYYKPGATSHASPLTGDLLSQPNSSGECTTWAHLFYEALLVNGALAALTIVVVKERRPGSSPVRCVFFVKNWSFKSPSPTTDPAYPYFFEFAHGGSSSSMVPLPSGGDFGDLVSQTGVPGQNADTPAEKSFDNHWIVNVFSSDAPNYYDPSYGVRYSNNDDFLAKAVDAVALIYGYAPGSGHLRLKVAVPNSIPNVTHEIQFTP